MIDSHVPLRSMRTQASRKGNTPTDFQAPHTFVRLPIGPRPPADAHAALSDRIQSESLFSLARL